MPHLKEREKNGYIIMPQSIEKEKSNTMPLSNEFVILPTFYEPENRSNNYITIPQLNELEKIIRQNMENEENLYTTMPTVEIERGSEYTRINMN